MSTENILPADLNGVHIHFVGIKGTGMVALVEIAHQRGAIITGSDVPEKFYTDEILNKLKIKVFTTFNATNINDDVQFVIYSSAYKRNQNPDLLEADMRKIPIMLYNEALGAISALAYSCGISGVHGKTTTTGLTGTVLKMLNIPAQVLAGSIISSFGNTCTLNNGKKYFVAETCEYQRHFMTFHPQKIILTSVESDHEDFYPTYESIRDAFVDYALLLPNMGQLIYSADDKGAVEVAKIVADKRSDIQLIPYGVYAKNDYSLKIGEIKDGKQFFKISAFEDEFVLKIPGDHMVSNACAACALAIELLKHFKQKENLSKEDMQNVFQNLKDGFASFTGAKRRSEIIAEKNNILIMDDYAHHPTAITTTLAGLRKFYPNKRIIVDFMSHTYTRTAALLDRFAESFSSADEVILHKIYPSAREKYDGNVTGKVLFEKTKQNHTKVSYYEEVLDALPYVQSIIKSGDLFITMGAGDNWKIGKLLAEKLNEQTSTINT